MSKTIDNWIVRLSPALLIAVDSYDLPFLFTGKITEKTEYLSFLIYKNKSLRVVRPAGEWLPLSLPKKSEYLSVVESCSNYILHPTTFIHKILVDLRNIIETYIRLLFY